MSVVVTMAVAVTVPIIKMTNGMFFLAILIISVIVAHRRKARLDNAMCGRATNGVMAGVYLTVTQQ
jgi:hypothetical protein